jgi:ABC-type bacteriocin/lantibiotic exporter with double-glycine peptidase domain
MFFMRYKARPGHFFGSLGLGLGALAMLIMVYLFIDKFIMGDDIGTRPLLMVGVVLLLSSVQMVTTGILAEMIARTYYRDDASPNYIVRAIFDRDHPHA